MKNRTLFLRINTQEVFFDYMHDIDKCDYYVFKPGSLIFKVLNKVNLNRIMFSSWKKTVKNYDLFILGENSYSSQISSYIKKKNRNSKIIMFFLNVINDSYKVIFNDKNIDEFWTFDKNDAKKYNIHYNPQFYSNEIVLNDKKIKNDILYIGRDKGRKRELINIKNDCEKKGIITNFYIIQSEKNYLPYDECLNMIAESKCILDYNQSTQIGLSLRPLEALFFEKKLITNNTDIVNYDFYNPDNIFIIGQDDDNNLKNFLDKPYKKVDKKIVNYYDYKSWIKRFEEEK